MKMLQAVIRASKLNDVKTALVALGLTGMTVTHVKGFGRQRGHKEVYRGAEYEVTFISKIKIEILVEDDLVAEALQTIRLVAQTGQIGDGKIFVIPVEYCIRIRTGETGRDAL